MPSLPKPVESSWNWQLQASCRTTGVDFFPDHHGRRRDRDAQERDAKQICRECPVMRECLSYAIQAGEPHGVWGGTTPRERALMEAGVLRTG
nr:WhiB family transcriptional regulator [Williamsia sterculiae]